MDFELPAELIDLRTRVANFVRDEVIPLEREENFDLGALRQKARQAGIFGPQLPREWGGLGLGTVAMCVLFEQAGRSLLGPLALHCAAPDEGNMHLLSVYATPEQREQYLRPLVEGKIRSCFAMTEPAPGAGSDPTMILTRATRVGGGWEITGRKWFATGAAGSTFAIAMAITDPSVPAHKGVTMFLVPANASGFNIVRSVPTMGGHGGPGGHGEIDFDHVRVPDSAVLGKIGDGFKMAQVRLTPARLTHCMRWMGVAQRSLEIAIDYAKKRDAFGKKLAQHQSIQWMIADSEIELHASRMMVMQAAWKHERGDDIRHESSICKVFVAEAVNRVIDRAVQICGALGVSTDTPLEHFYREARAFRIYDGPSEVHRMVIARNLLR
ncbi:MAG: acyl-CoA dehydrogenase family protein [Thermoanaerobaculia bacterium]